MKIKFTKDLIKDLTTKNIDETVFVAVEVNGEIYNREITGVNGNGDEVQIETESIIL